MRKGKVKIKVNITIEIENDYKKIEDENIGNRSEK